MAKRLTKEEQFQQRKNNVIQTLNKYGYQLCEEYINATTPINIKCPNNHNIKLTFNCFRNGFRCKFCNYAKKQKEYEKNISQKLEIKLKQDDLIFVKYDHNTAKIYGKCHNGHDFTITYHSGNKKICCPNCVNYRKLTYNYVNQKVKEKGWRLLSEQNIDYNIYTKLNCLCDKGHNITVPWFNIKFKKKCQICCQNKKFTEQDIKDIVETDGWKWISTDRTNRSKKTKCLCNKGHIVELQLNTIRKNHRCPLCHKFYSEEKVRLHLEELTNKKWPKIKLKWLHSTSSTGRNYPLEIDCWNEELGVGVEVQGKQHYEFPNKFHKNIEKFQTQQAKDELKRKLFIENHKILIEIRTLDYYDSEKEMLKDLEKMLIEARVIRKCQE